MERVGTEARRAVTVAARARRRKRETFSIGELS
jgi:hypothetical protein